MKKWHWAILALLTLASIVAPFFAPHHDTGGHGDEAAHGGGHWWEGVPVLNLVFWAIFGFVGCAALIVFAKLILAPIIYKKEDYYND